MTPSSSEPGAGRESVRATLETTPSPANTAELFRLPAPSPTTIREDAVRAVTQSGAIAGFRPGRIVAVAYTPHAPMGGELGHTMFGPPVLAAVREILTRLERDPAHVIGKALQLGDVAVMAAKADEPRLPLAFVWEGLTEAEFNGALDALARDGWRPGPPVTLFQGDRP